MLKDRLNEMSAASAAKVSPETLAIMLRSREALSNSDIFDRVIKVGDKMSDFSLADETGQQVSIAGLRQTGAVVISIYRGVW